MAYRSQLTDIRSIRGSLSLARRRDSRVVSLTLGMHNSTSGLGLDASETASLPLPPPSSSSSLHSLFVSLCLALLSPLLIVPPPHHSSHAAVSLCSARRFGFGSARRHWLGPPASKPTRGFSTTPSLTYTSPSTPRQLDHRSAKPSPNLPPRLPLS